ncbi:MAG TPA: DUF4129 domain-containing protein [Pyrinomonadaceae bacterium]|jgi:hypothetical protein
MLRRPSNIPQATRFARPARFLTLIVVALCFGATAASVRVEAATLAEYRARVHRAALALDSLSLIDGDVLHMHERRALMPHRLAEVRSSLPPREKVEWDGGTLEVDNTLLHRKLDEYEQLPSDEGHTATVNRILAFLAITERLKALDDRLAEAENAPRIGLRDKDAEKGRLAAILRRPEYNRADAKKESALSRLLEQLRKWLRDLFPESAPLQPGTSMQLSRGAQIFVYALAAAVLAFVLWKYGGHIWRRAGKRRAQDEREPRVVLGEVLRADETPSDLLAEAERLALQGNLRGAIRKAYIALLCELGDRRIIRLAQHKTNRDYLDSLRRERAPLYRELQPLTLNFERHWYGHHAATADDWTSFRTRCRQALNYSGK